MFNENVVRNLIVKSSTQITIPIDRKVRPSDLVFTIYPIDTNNSNGYSFSIWYYCQTIANEELKKMLKCQIQRDMDKPILFWGSNFDTCQECEKIISCNKIVIGDDNIMDFKLSIYTFDNADQKSEFEHNRNDKAIDSKFIYCEFQDLF